MNPRFTSVEKFTTNTEFSSSLPWLVVAQLNFGALPETWQVYFQFITISTAAYCFLERPIPL